MAGARLVAQVDVNTMEVDTLLQSVMSAVSPPSMVRFGENVADYLSDRVANRFAVEGDDASGNWPELSPATKRIRASMGYGADGPINRRTDDLFKWVAYSANIAPIEGGVQVTTPDTDSMDALALKKLTTAQKGDSNNPNFPNAVTPPRPVVAINAYDMTQIMAKLQLHIMASTINKFVSLGTI